MAKSSRLCEEALSHRGYCRATGPDAGRSPWHRNSPTVAHGRGRPLKAVVGCSARTNLVAPASGGPAFLPVATMFGEAALPSTSEGATHAQGFYLHDTGGPVRACRGSGHNSAETPDTGAQARG